MWGFGLDVECPFCWNVVGCLCCESNVGLDAGAVASAPPPPSKESLLHNLKEVVVPVTPPEVSRQVFTSLPGDKEATVSITVVGASGDLAKKKIFPALFALYYEDCLPKVLACIASIVDCSLDLSAL